MNNIKVLKKEMRDIFDNSLGSHDWEHTKRVYNMAMHLCDVEKANKEIVAAAALLHDIGRSEQDRTKGHIAHEVLGCTMARPILQRYGYSEDYISQILHCIKSHRFRKGPSPKTIEAKVLFDADKLDAIGAIGIGRAFVFAGESGAAVHIPGLNLEETISYSREDTAYREFMVKLIHVKGRMYTDEGRRLATARHSFMVEFFARLDNEAAGLI